MEWFSMDISLVCQDLTVQPLPPPLLLLPLSHPLPHLHPLHLHHPRPPHLHLALALMVALDIQNLSDI